jgi:hypothetical protein
VASTPAVLGHGVRAPSTLGTFLRSFTWGHVSQLDRVFDEVICRARASGAGPGTGPVTLDVDSSICETYGFAKQGARFGHTGVRCQRSSNSLAGPHGVQVIPHPGVQVIPYLPG